jgi:hypothetical protein
MGCKLPLKYLVLFFKDINPKNTAFKPNKLTNLNLDDKGKACIFET